MAKPSAGSSLFNRGPLFQEPPSPPKDEGSTPPSPDGGSTTPVNTKPPAGSSLLFGALADSGKIKQRKNGSYRMVLEGVDGIDWFSDRPNRVEGTWKPQKLLRKWDKYFASSEPNAQATVEVGEEQQMATFEMFKPKMKSGKMIFDVKPLTDSSKDKLTGLQDIELSDISLFIDEATPGVPSCFPNCRRADLRGMDIGAQKLYSDFIRVDMRSKGKTQTNLVGADLTGAQLLNAKMADAILLGANLTDANLTDADLTGAELRIANLTNTYLKGATYDSTTKWPTAEWWDNTTCPDGTNSDNNQSCGF